MPQKAVTLFSHAKTHRFLSDEVLALLGMKHENASPKQRASSDSKVKKASLDSKSRAARTKTVAIGPLEIRRPGQPTIVVTSLKRETRKTKANIIRETKAQRDMALAARIIGTNHVEQ